MKINNSSSSQLTCSRNDIAEKILDCRKHNHSLTQVLNINKRELLPITANHWTKTDHGTCWSRSLHRTGIILGVFEEVNGIPSPFDSWIWTDSLAPKTIISPLHITSIRNWNALPSQLSNFGVRVTATLAILRVVWIGCRS